MTAYLAITPARDEGKFLPGLIASMASQTCVASRWIVIDDGSSDATGELIDAAARTHRWIQPHHLARSRARAPGGESVIMEFLPKNTWRSWEFILRIDADVTFPSNLIESLLAEFGHDATLGIAGPVLLEAGRGGWREVKTPRFHTRGAMKMYSGACFEAIGGLEPGLGWDTIDEMRASMLGFTTRSFPHLRAFHHRPAGAASGLWRARVAAGRAAYYVGYSPLFMMVRAMRHCFQRPSIVGALMLAGYCQGYLHRWPRPASAELVRFVRRQQIRRLLLRESIWR